MAEHKIRHIRITSLHNTLKVPDILYDRAVSVRMTEKPELLLRCDAQAVSEKVEPADTEAVLIEHTGKSVIPVNELDHAVRDLKDCLHTAFRLPDDRVKACLLI